MLLTVLSVPACPNTPLLLDRLRIALDGQAVDLDVIVVEDLDGARRWGMTGSPTLLVDGADPFTPAGVEASVSCRLHYSDDGAVSSAPSVTELRAAQRALLLGMAESGSPPGLAAIDRLAEPYGRRGLEVLRELAAEDFVTLDQAGGLRAIYPFSVEPSPHRVRIEDGA